MNHNEGSSARNYAEMPDSMLVELALRDDRGAFKQIMQRCNQRLFRVARGVVNDDTEAEDIVQESYVHAYEKLATFRGDASILTWLTRIVLNEAYGRLRRRHDTVDIAVVESVQVDSCRIIAFPSKFGGEDPAADAARNQIRIIIEHAIEKLPEAFRIVFVMREIEGCSVDETAAALQLRPETVKTRLHRARRQLKAALHERLASALSDAFPFLGPRCDRMTSEVMKRLDQLDSYS